MRRRYERLRRFPESLLPIGDAVCRLNPVYGQGTTVSAPQALALREHVLQHGSAEPRRWLRRAARVIEAPGDMVVGADLAFAEVQGPRTASVRLLGAYLARLHAAATRDPHLAVTFVRVTTLVDPPTSLVTVGAPNPVTPVAAAREIVEGLTTAPCHLEVLVDTGHIPWLDDLDRYWPHIQRFTGAQAREPMIDADLR